MKRMQKKIWSFIVLVTMSCLVSMGQQEYALNSANSKLTIKGTSSLHDWTMEAHDPACTSFFETENSVLKKVNQVAFSCRVEKILSGESSIMDSKAKEALKVKSFPVITFKFASLNDIKSLAGNHFEGKITGTLSMAGKAKSVTIPFSGNMVGNKVLIKGNVPIKMSDFGITPPTAMLGALKTGDNLVLDYSFEFNPSANSTKTATK